MGDKPPSRRRYEKENPIINFRIDKELKEGLEKMLEDIEEEKYKVEYPCNECGEPLEVTKEEEKEKSSKY